MSLDNRALLEEALGYGPQNVVFTKADGSTRIMNVASNEQKAKLIQESGYVFKGRPQTDEQLAKVMHVWDLDNNAFRSIALDRIISIVPI